MVLRTHLVYTYLPLSTYTICVLLLLINAKHVVSVIVCLCVQTCVLPTCFTINSLQNIDYFKMFLIIILSLNCIIGELTFLLGR